jgi:HEAT repeat protein
VTQDRDVQVREMAAWALGSIEDSKGNAALLTAARGDSSERVRETAVWALAQIEDESSVDALGAIAGSDRSARVRGTAAWAIGQIQDDDGHAPAGLVKLLSDENADVRLKAAWSLGQIGDTSALPAIRDAMKREKEPRITKALIRALMKSGEQSEATLTQLLDSPDPAVREAAVRGLAGSSSRDPWPWPEPRPRPFP